MEKWILKNKCKNYLELSQIVGVSNLIGKIATNRGHITPDSLRNYVQPCEASVHDPYKLFGMNDALKITMEAIEKKKKIAIVGDYDVDGIMSSAILYKTIHDCGGDVVNIIPNRITDGYGINENIVTDLYMMGVDLVITCDNGVSAFGAIAAAKEEGMSVIVIDHHEFKYGKNELGEKHAVYVDADAIINPQNPLCKYPFKKLCAGYLSYKFGSALMEKYKKGMDEELLVFAAMATICDVVDLVDENRYIVKEGLEKISKTKNIGLNELLKANGLEGKKISTYHVGFVIGPCLNASGRLENATLALELLTTDNISRARELSLSLVDLNIERRNLTELGEKEAEAAVLDNKDAIKILYLPQTHESIAGIIAGRMKEKYNHPFIVLTNSSDNHLKGSARSVESINIIEEITKTERFLKKYGGHPMAAGLTLEKDNLDDFIKEINKEHLDFQPLKLILVDTILKFVDVSEATVEELASLEPYGKGNEKPVIALTGVKVMNYKEIGKSNQFLKLQLVDRDESKVEALYFGKKKEELLEIIGGGRRIDIIFSPTINEYLGRKKIQIIVDNYRISVDDV